MLIWVLAKEFKLAILTLCGHDSAERQKLSCASVPFVSPLILRNFVEAKTKKDWFWRIPGQQECSLKRHMAVITEMEAQTDQAEHTCIFPRTWKQLALIFWLYFNALPVFTHGNTARIISWEATEEDRAHFSDITSSDLTGLCNISFTIVNIILYYIYIILIACLLRGIILCLTWVIPAVAQGRGMQAVLVWRMNSLPSTRNHRLPVEQDPLSQSTVVQVPASCWEPFRKITCILQWLTPLWFLSGPCWLCSDKSLESQKTVSHQKHCCSCDWSCSPWPSLGTRCAGRSPWAAPRRGWGARTRPPAQSPWGSLGCPGGWCWSDSAGTQESSQMIYHPSVEINRRGQKRSRQPGPQLCFCAWPKVCITWDWCKDLAGNEELSHSQCPGYTNRL